MAAIYLDENVARELGRALRALGYDAIHTADVARKGASDVDQLSFAARSGRVFITYDVDHFEMLHEAWSKWSRDWAIAASARHSGILLLPDPGLLTVPEAARVVNELLAEVDTVENRLFAWTARTGWREIIVET